ncbi:sirohydrochlorin chelatase [Embleya sp. NPDC020630]|uniref:sirohydrochlorin chelatase n=1 Tax=Embleya sp. NPDC020630 TaxID=3363979 RepID=UPI00378884EA
MSDHTRVIVVCGRESGQGADLRELAGPDTSVVTPGRELHRALATRPSGQYAVVVPMTLGREPGLVAETARTVRALPPKSREGVAVAEPFGTTDHLVGWLRAAANAVAQDAALLVIAPSGDPYEDAELDRAAYLVRRNGRHRLVETALIGGDPDVAEGLRRCVLLGARRIAVLPASFAAAPLPSAVDGVPVSDAGPLLCPAALAAVLAARVRTARHRLRDHGDDGVGRALGAADGFGLGHTHGLGDEHHHDHGGGHHPHHGPGAEHHHSHGPGGHQGHRGPGEGRDLGGSPQERTQIHIRTTTPPPTAATVTAAGTRSHP